MAASIVQIILMILEWWLRRQSENAAALESFYEFVHSLDRNHLSSVAAGKEWRAQREALRQLLERQKQIELEKIAEQLASEESERLGIGP